MYSLPVNAYDVATYPQSEYIYMYVFALKCLQKRGSCRWFFHFQPRLCSKPPYYLLQSPPLPFLNLQLSLQTLLQ